MQVEFRPSPEGSWAHAVSLLLSGHRLTDVDLAAALAPSSLALAELLAAHDVHIDRFRDHLAPLSHGAISPRELAEALSRKLAGSRAPPSAAADPSADREGPLASLLVPPPPPRPSVAPGDLRPGLELCLAEAAAAFRRQRPDAAEELSLRAGPISQLWEARGPGLLLAMQRRTEAALFVERASALLVLPQRGGYGAPHPRYNIVRFEAVLADPAPQLPEVVRLGWLLAQLNLDLARFERVGSPDRVAHLGALAMAPCAIAAAEHVELAHSGPRTLELALDTWFLDRPSIDAATLDGWWQAYDPASADFEVALMALDRLMAK